MRQLPFPNLHIKAYRGLRDLHLEECGAINLLVGDNNSGKTSVLESLLLLTSPRDPRQWEGAVELRTTWPLVDMRFRPSSIGRLNALTWLFPHSGDTIGAIEVGTDGPAGNITATVQQILGAAPDSPLITPTEIVEGSFRSMHRRDQKRDESPTEFGIIIDISFAGGSLPDLLGDLQSGFRMVLWETGRSFRVQRKLQFPSISAAFATPISHRSDGYLANRVSALIRAKRKERAIDLLKSIDSKVKDLVMVTQEGPESDAVIPRAGGIPTLHVEYGDSGLVPIHAMGDGLRRALHFAAVLADLEEGGVLLIDEVEVGMHTSVLRDGFKWLCQACREFGVQVFASTHSLEAVDAMLEGVSDDDLVLYRLRNGSVRRFAGEMLRVSRIELGQEVR